MHAVDDGRALVVRKSVVVFPRQQDPLALPLERDADGAGVVEHDFALVGSGGPARAGIGAAMRGIENDGDRRWSRSGLLLRRSRLWRGLLPFGAEGKPRGGQQKRGGDP